MKRRCLKCRKKFTSAGPGNRLCKTCLRVNTSVYEKRPVVVAGEAGRVIKTERQPS